MSLPTAAERDNLIAVYQRVKDAQEDYKAAIEKVALKTDRAPSALRKWVQALARDEAEKTKNELQEALDLFDAEAEGDIEDGVPGHLGRVNPDTGGILRAVKVADAIQTAGRMRHEWSSPVGGHG